MIKISKEDKDEEAFYSDSFSTFFNPGQFVIDFKQSIPKIEESDEKQEQKTVVSHRPILMNPALAKKLYKILEKNIEKYEEKFSEIEIGKNRDAETQEESGEEVSYIG